MLIAAFSGTTAGIVVAAYLAICLLAWLISPRDVLGRRRANGCVVGLVLFFGLFVVAFAAWAADNVF